MKKQLILPVFLVLAACSPGGNKQAQLEQYKKQAAETQAKIEALEAELAQESPEAPLAESLPVEVEAVLPTTFTRHFEVRGSMEAVSEAFISPEINGQIQHVAVRRGQQVKRGALLLSLNTDITQLSIEEVKTNLELAQIVYDKQEELWEKNIGSELQYLEARNNLASLEARLATLQKQLELASITAPFDGVVEEIMVKKGELASPGMPLLHLVNLDRMRIKAQVSEAYLNSVRKGDQVELRFPSYPDWVIREPVTRLGEVIDASTRTFTLEVEVDNQGDRLKPNMLTSVRIRDYEAEGALVVNTALLREDFKGTFLFKAVESGEGYQARKTYVEKGITVQDQTQISTGLSEGDLVVTRGYNLVADQMPIRILNP